MPAATVWAEVSRHRQAIRACHRHNPGCCTGEDALVTVQFVIGPAGKVTHAEVSGPVEARQAIEACVLQEIRTLKLPRTGKGKPVKAWMRFLFEPGPSE
jgi:hypothetical protein